jgi:hypothetical protein
MGKRSKINKNDLMRMYESGMDLDVILEKKIPKRKDGKT